MPIDITPDESEVDWTFRPASLESQAAWLARWEQRYPAPFDRRTLELLERAHTLAAERDGFKYLLSFTLAKVHNFVLAQRKATAR